MLWINKDGIASEAITMFNKPVAAHVSAAPQALKIQEVIFGKLWLFQENHRIITLFGEKIAIFSEKSSEIYK